MNQPIYILVLIAIALIYCCFTDAKYRLIKNYITFPMMLLGLVTNTILYGWAGAKVSLIGIAVGLIFGLVMGAFGAIGLGDVKLYMGIGAFFGSVFTIETILLSFFAGIPVAFFMAPKDFLESARNLFLFVKLTILTRQKQKLITEGYSLTSIPFAICIFLGSVGAYFSKGEILQCLFY